MAKPPRELQSTKIRGIQSSAKALLQFLMLAWVAKKSQ